MPYVVVPYLDRMELAYAAADLALCRAGAITCAELAAVGLPAVYVPLPHGNGEQRLNATPVVAAGGGLLVDDADLTAAWVGDHVPSADGDPAPAGRDGRSSRYARPARRRRPPRGDGPACGGRCRQQWRYVVIVAPPDRVLSADELGRVHFVGIGGAGMSGIARILLARGVPVSGSDAKDSSVLAAPAGHRRHRPCRPRRPTHVDDADTVVVSTAIRETNPEVVEARRRGLRVLPRAAALASVMAGRRAVAVAGTHGKTTTTSMLTVALQHCGADPSFAIGGNLNESGANAHNGTGDVFVAEADESDGSFLAYDPEVAIVTNVEADHLDNYGTVEAYDAGVRVRSPTVPGGFLVACADDPGARRARPSGPGLAASTCSTYGEAADADMRVAEIDLAGSGVSFDLVARGRRQGRVTLRLPGRHNALNASAALHRRSRPRVRRQ